MGPLLMYACAGARVAAEVSAVRRRHAAARVLGQVGEKQAAAAPSLTSAEIM
jgi:hypothetical protein